MQDSKKLLELCSDGGYESVTSLLKSKDKGAAINATFEEVFVSSVLATCGVYCDNVVVCSGGEVGIDAGM